MLTGKWLPTTEVWRCLVFQAHICHTIRKCGSVLLLSLPFFPIWNEKTENKGKHVIYFYKLLDWNKMVQEILIIDLQPPSSIFQWKHHGYAQIISLAERELNTFPFLSGIELELSDRNVDYSKKYNWAWLWCQHFLSLRWPLIILKYLL